VVRTSGWAGDVAATRLGVNRFRRLLLGARDLSGFASA
jgi:hypothetical protein